ncbi:MAG: choice-of-anchor D domain-containing protein [Saprospiraceae bacterium]|nr:choice-of-anchor D domain-containing protein [Saprospiraceae bacterium]
MGFVQRSYAQVTETYETEVPGATTFSEGGLVFTKTGDWRVVQSTSFGCCPSDRFWDTGVNNGASSGSVGQIIVSTLGKGFQVQELDAWSSNDDGNSFAVGNATFIGIRPNGTTVTYATDINPTGNLGTSFEHFNFAATPLNGITLIGLEIQLAAGLNYVAIDNFKFLSVDIPCVTINDVSIAEGNSGTTNLVFTATLTNAASGAFTVNYATANNTATTANSDYVSASGMLNFAGTNGETKTITVVLNGDVTSETDETFFVNLTNASNINVRIFDAQGIGTIQNDDSGASFSIAATNAVKLEGNSGTTPFFFTVSRSGDASGSNSVNYTVAGSGGNPANTADFGGAFPSGTVTFTPLETSKQVQINVSGDVTDETDEGFSVTLSGPTGGAVITTSTATGTILDDEMFLETFEGESTPGMAFSENGNMFTTTTPLRVYQSSGFGCCPSNYFIDGAGTGAIGSVQYNNAGIGGVILQEVDMWTSSNGGSTFAVGNVTVTGTRPNGTTVSHTFTVTPTGNTGADFQHKLFAGTPLQNEVLRSFAITNVSPINYLQIDNLKYGLGTQGALSINDVSITEGNSGTQNLVFTVTHTGVSGAFTVSYATSNNSAGGSDFMATSGMLSFAGTNNETLTITVPINGDQEVELDESFYVNLGAISNPAVTLQDGQGIGTILNNDAATVSINDVSMNEGNSGTTIFTFTLTLSHAVNTSLSVVFNTANNTATSGDYVTNSSTVTFNGTAGETKTVQITVNGDTDFEPDETFFVNLSSLSAGGRAVTISDNQALGTILNDDPLPVPEMDVQGNGNPIADGATTVATTNNTNFGTVCIGGTPVTRTFTILNTGFADLILDGMPRVGLTGHTSDFMVNLQPASPVSSLGSTTFTITFSPTASGTRSVTVSIENNDSNEDPYTFVLEGMAFPTENASFAYANTGYCQAGADPAPQVFGTLGGMFTAPLALSINASSGIIDVSASTAGGPYTVTYTTTGACPATGTFAVSIVNCVPGAILTDALLIDNGPTGQAQPGDRIRLTAKISNGQAADYEGVQLTLNNDPRVTLTPVSFKSTPVAVADAYTTTMNTVLNIAAGSGVLVNDFDDNLPGLTVTGFSATSAQGGTVSVSANGAFTYTPPTGFTGNDTFTYTVTDSDSQTDTATVRVRVQ